MRQKFYKLFFFCLFISLQSFSADPYMGGYLQLSRTSSNNYTLNLHLYVSQADQNNANNLANGLLTSNFVAKIYRKRDNADVTSDANATGLLNLTPRSLTGTSFNYPSPPACSNPNDLKSTDILLSSNITLDPTKFNDIQGYYVVAETCCRNQTLANVQNPGNESMLFYLSFSPSTITNSTPVIRQPVGSYFCLNNSVTLALPASDADGDQLDYSLGTPYRGYSTPTAPLVLPALNNPPEVAWASGFNATSPLPSTPAVSINTSNGNVSFKATSVGVYAITLIVKERRGGSILSETHLEYQIIVKDCGTPERPRIFLEGGNPTVHVNPLQLCTNSFRVLETQANPNYTYTWYHNNIAVPNSNTNKLRINATGDYKVTVNDPTASCLNTQTSADTRVLPLVGITLNTSTSLGNTICENQAPGTLSATISGGNANDYSFSWTIDGTNFNSNQNIPYRISGTYRILVTQNAVPNCTYDKEEVIVVNPLPVATINNITGKTSACDGEKVQLEAITEATSTFIWKKDGINFSTNTQIDITTTGNYSLTVTSDKNCVKNAPDVKIDVYPIPVVSFAPISPFCSTANSQKDLTSLVQPQASGGVFSGKGMSGSVFNPILAGYGRWPITYTFTSSDGCSNSATSDAVVDITPVVKLGNDLTIYRGDAIKINAGGSQGADFTYTWSPTDGLATPIEFSPMASPTATTTYVLEVSSTRSNCKASADIVVNVFPKLKIPNTFTPNSDRINDTWEIEGVEEYPEIEVKIFNRWGNEIFYSQGYKQPFNAIKDDQKYPSGTYYYVIKPNVNLPAETGYLTIVR